MKQIYLAVCCVCIGLFSHAQFNKGQRMIGGLFYLTATDNQANSTLIDNITFGTLLSYSKFKSPMSFYSIGVSYNYSGNKNYSYSNGFGLNYGYTQLQTLAKKFYLGISGSGSTNFNYNNSYNLSGNTSSKSIGWGIEANGSVGLFYQLNNRFLLTTNLINLVTISYGQQRYQYIDANNNITSTENGSSWRINTGLTGFSLMNIGIGVKYLLK